MHSSWNCAKTSEWRSRTGRAGLPMLRSYSKALAGSVKAVIGTPELIKAALVSALAEPIL